MKPFLDDNFLLNSDTAALLYHNYASGMPIVDYHCHLDPTKISENYMFSDLTEIWLGGDHYKWRAMRAHGINESYITGNKSPKEKFLKWAEVVPYTMCNPLYHWTHLELRRFFGIYTLLNPATAEDIYDECNAKLNTDEFTARALMLKMNVKAVGTTDDPIDNLSAHLSILKEKFSIKVLPTWRPDKVMAIDNIADYNAYMDKLEAASGISISNFSNLTNALRKRMNYFSDAGCKMSDHGIDTFYFAQHTESEIADIFSRIRSGKEINADDNYKFKAGMLLKLAEMNSEKGWVQQFHIGPIRNNNTRLFKALGADIGCDSIHDIPFSEAGNRFFGKLDESEKLSRTILYNLNPAFNEVLATMAGNFNSGQERGKMQFGSGWWFLDQKSGMEKQIDTLSKLGLLSNFVGMLTDSRSFLSYPRHEYFRRILCNIIGNQVENGELPASEIPFLGNMVKDICYNNAKNMLNLE